MKKTLIAVLLLAFLPAVAGPPVTREVLVRDWYTLERVDDGYSRCYVVAGQSHVDGMPPQSRSTDTSMIFLYQTKIIPDRAWDRPEVVRITDSSYAEEGVGQHAARP